MIQTFTNDSCWLDIPKCWFLSLLIKMYHYWVISAPSFDIETLRWGSPYKVADGMSVALATYLLAH